MTKARTVTIIGEIKCEFCGEEVSPTWDDADGIYFCPACGISCDMEPTEK